MSISIMHRLGLPLGALLCTTLASSLALGQIGERVRDAIGDTVRGAREGIREGVQRRFDRPPQLGERPRFEVRRRPGLEIGDNLRIRFGQGDNTRNFGARLSNRQGLRVNNVIDGSLAQRFGLRAGDEILAVNRNWVRSYDGFRGRLRDAAQNQQAAWIYVNRNGERQWVRADFRPRAGIGSGWVNNRLRIVRDRLYGLDNLPNQKSMAQRVSRMITRLDETGVDRRAPLRSEFRRDLSRLRWDLARYGRNQNLDFATRARIRGLQSAIANIRGNLGGDDFTSARYRGNIAASVRGLRNNLANLNVDARYQGEMADIRRDLAQIDRLLNADATDAQFTVDELENWRDTTAGIRRDLEAIAAERGDALDESWDTAISDVAAMSDDLDQWIRFEAEADGSDGAADAETDLEAETDAGIYSPYRDEQEALLQRTQRFGEQLNRFAAENPSFTQEDVQNLQRMGKTLTTQVRALGEATDENVGERFDAARESLRNLDSTLSEWYRDSEDVARQQTLGLRRQAAGLSDRFENYEANWARDHNARTRFDSDFGFRTRYGQEGLTVDGVRENSPAAKAGFQSGDRIISAGEQPVRSAAGFSDVLDARGQTQVRVNRRGQEVDLTARFGGDTGALRAPDGNTSGDLDDQTSPGGSTGLDRLK